VKTKTKTRAALLQHRWRAQGLARPLGDTPEEVVGRLGAVQAENFSLAKWSVGRRTAGANHETVELALANGTILRTHLLRPTWHFVLARDIRWMQRLTAPRVRAMSASRRRELELDPPLLSRSRKIISEALEGGQHRTRRQLAERLGMAGIETGMERLAHIVMDAELEGLICSGKADGKSQTYALLDERAPAGQRLEEDEALAELARRYFTTRGPATEHDFRWWSSLRAVDARQAIESIQESLERVDQNGRTYWLGPDGGSPIPGRSSPIQLIPRLDEYVVAYTRSRDVMLGSRSDQVQILSQRDEHPVLRRGQFAGSWQRRVTRNGLQIVLLPGAQLDPADFKSLERAAAEYGRFFSLTVALLRD
jgi:hypothetical protein